MHNIYYRVQHEFLYIARGWTTCGSLTSNLRLPNDRIDNETRKKKIYIYNNSNK